MQSDHKLTIFAVLFGFFAAPLGAQSPAQVQQILERLDRLENENRALAQEVRALRRELAAAHPPAPGPENVNGALHDEPDLAERVAIQEQRIADQAQTKVEASQRFPIKITGMALFNVYRNSRNNGGRDYPTVAAPEYYRNAGASFRQTVIGLDYRGPQTVWGGKLHGNVYMDFFGGSGGSLDQLVRVRTASMDVDWKTRSVSVGLEKPIFNPREPNSLAWVGISPLTGAGNLWLWLPQARFEQLIPFSGETTGLRAQIGVVETHEGDYTQGQFEVEPARPGLEGRFEFFHRFASNGRLEIAPGFHASTTHAAETHVPSNLFSLDWYFRPVRRIEWTGVFFSGQNVHHLGAGAIRQGYRVFGDGDVRPVHSLGGWGQLTLNATERLSFNLFSGQHDDRDSDLVRGRIGKNLVYGANFAYRLAPNVILGLEASQTRTRYISVGTLLNNHYDLGLAYLF